MRFEKFKKPALSAVAFFGTLGAVSIGYSAYVANYPAAATAGVTALSATEWNKMVTALQTLDNNLSNLSFSGGRVGIGASSPATKLHIIGPAITGAPWIGEAVRMESSSYPGNYASLFIDMSGVSSGLSFGMNGNRSLYVANSGNVGIGMTTPQNALHVSGNIGATGWVGAGCETNCSDVASGYSILYADGWGRATWGWTTASDSRLKADIRPIEDPIGKLKMINGVTYRMKDGDGSRKTGVIAQDVEKVFPELIVENSNGYKSVSYDKLVAPLIEAVKIQQVRIEELETRLQKMETAGN